MYSAYLVDDDELILEELIGIVPWMDNGFNVIGSNTDPEKALEEIAEFKPNVVFSDLKMPTMDGNELIARIREMNIDCEFVMISAYDKFENVRLFFQQSGFDYILKPVKPDDIQIVLEKLQFRLNEKYPADTDKGPLSPGFDALVEYVDTHFTEKLSLTLLASKFNFSKNYICNLFAKNFHTSLTCYITEHRMKKAKELLKDPSRLMKDIAVSCGYSEYFHFFKVFKEYYGVSPKEMQEGVEA